VEEHHQKNCNRLEPLNVRPKTAVPASSMVDNCHSPLGTEVIVRHFAPESSNRHCRPRMLA
jgi:hypothetical protein